MSFWFLIFPLLLPGELILGLFAFPPACGIVVQPQASQSNSNRGSAGDQVGGIIIGPGSSSSSWLPSSASAISVFNWKYFLNQECRSDTDCYPSRTILFCINHRCQCITGGAAYLNGLHYNYNMEWSEYNSQCISQTGSVCFLQGYSTGHFKMDCVPGHDCMRISNPIVKVSSASTQGVLGYGSDVSFDQLKSQNPPVSYQQHLQYFGSGVTNLNNAAPVNNANDHGNFEQHAASSSVAIDAATPWGICIRRQTSTSTGVVEPIINSAGIVDSIGSDTNSADFKNGLSVVLTSFTLSLSLLTCAI